MRTIIYWLAAGVGVVVAAHDARAQHGGFMTRDAGPYFRAAAGVSLTEEGRVRKFTPGPSGGGIDFDPGFNVNAAVGFAFNPYFALEFELGGSGNEIHSVKGLAIADTFLYNAPFLANVVLQYPIPRTIVTPYIGAGAGGSVTGFDTDYFSNGAPGSPVLVGSDSDVVFAWQVFAGLRFDLNEHMSMGAGYKYFVTGDSSFTYSAFNGQGPDVHLGIEGTRSHMIMFVFNMKF
jgi:opacity protein-like surface antigen